MCLIIIKENGKKLVSNQMISEVWLDNPHGAGIIYKRNGSDIYQMIKGLMTEDDLHDTISKLKLGKKDFIAYHLRWATSGKLDAANTHPFIVHEDVGTVSSLEVHNTKKTMFVMHNGVIYDLNDKKAKYSDTIRFISEYLSKIPMHDLFKSPTIKALIEKFIDGSRLFLAHSRYGHTLYGTWHEHEGYLISKPYKEATKSSCYYTDETYWWSYPKKAEHQGQMQMWDLPEGKESDNDSFCDCCGYTTDVVEYDDDWGVELCNKCKNEYSL